MRNEPDTLERFGVGLGQDHANDDLDDEPAPDDEPTPEPDDDKCHDCRRAKPSVGERAPYGVDLCASCYLGREGVDIGDGPRTDGGESVDGMERRDPSEDPHACTGCGVFIGTFPDGEYCDACAREFGTKPPMQRCFCCGRDGPQEQMKPIDLSRPDEYYPKIAYLCWDCSGTEREESDR